MFNKETNSGFYSLSECFASIKDAGGKVKVGNLISKNKRYAYIIYLCKYTVENVSCSWSGTWYLPKLESI